MAQIKPWGAVASEKRGASAKPRIKASASGSTLETSTPADAQIARIASTKSRRRAAKSNERLSGSWFRMAKSSASSAPPKTR
ncbi:hypothetical protein D3C86_1230160 [compost metagenome]